MKRRVFLRGAGAVSTGFLLLPAKLKAIGSLINPPVKSDDSSMIDVKKSGKKLVHFWSNCVGAGRANEGLRASWQEQLRFSKMHCGFNYCRFHGLFHDDMFVYAEQGGKPVYNWQYVDDLFDRMLEKSVRPFVELSFMPKDLASTKNTTFWWKAHSCPPTDFGKWESLVGELVKHCIGRYGIDEVRKWYFEVWNEPDLHGFWDGTKSQYFELYKVSARAVKAIDSQLRIGGPASSNFVPDGRFNGEVEDKSKDKTLTARDINALDWRGVWIKDFLNYCEDNGLPLDFISTHPYPTDYAIDPETKKGGSRTREVDATLHDIQWLRKTIAESAFTDVQIHLTEWSSSPSSRDAMHDALPVAAYIMKVNLDCAELVDSLSYWTFTDIFEEAGAGAKMFYGGFGLINYQGIVKPSFHAYRMLNQLGDKLLHKEEGMVVTTNSQTGKVTALLYHYPKEMKDTVGGDVEKVMNTGRDKLFEMNLKGLNRHCKFSVEVLNKHNGNVLAAWTQMGSPASASIEQTERLKALAMGTLKETIFANSKGILRWHKILAPWTCVLFKEV